MNNHDLSPSDLNAIHISTHSNIDYPQYCGVLVNGERGEPDAQGTVPTNRTSRDILKSQDEDLWHSAEAGLFHDFGKANQLFQQGLTATSGRRFQPYRHEWISLRLFQAFVGKQTDTEWLCSLAEVSSANEDEMLSRLERDPQPENANIFASLPPLAQAVAWLIVSHHRLPVYPQYSPNPEINYQAQPQFTDSALWLETQFNSVWNSTNQDAGDWTEQDLQRVAISAWHAAA